MELNFAFVASSAEVGPDGRFFVLGGGIEGFTIPRVPSVVAALAVVANLHFTPDECGAGYPLRVTLTRPSGADGGLEIQSNVIANNPLEIPDFGARVKVAISIYNLVLPEVGRYHFNFFVADRLIGNLEVNVALLRDPLPAGR
jgi:hypothetical protein